MSRKQLVVEIITIPLIRGILMLGLACVFAIFGIVGKLIALGITALYIYTVVDEVKLFIEAYHEADH